jgi:hypothetical protein
MYQFSEQLNNAVAPVDSAFASVALYELSEAHRATACGDPYGCDISEAIHRWGTEFFQPSRSRNDHDSAELLSHLEACRSCNCKNS